MCYGEMAIDDVKGLGIKDYVKGCALG